MAEATEREKAQRIVAENRKALHDYHILETFEAGVVLQGTVEGARIASRALWGRAS